VRRRDVSDVRKQRQAVPRHVAPLVAVDEGVDGGRRRVDLVAARDLLQRRAVDHGRVDRAQDEAVLGGIVVCGALGELLRERVDGGRREVVHVVERRRVPVVGRVRVVAPLRACFEADQLVSSAQERCVREGGSSEGRRTGPPLGKLVTAANDDVMTMCLMPASCRRARPCRR